MNCTNCGQPLKAGSGFCTSCGATVAGAPPPMGPPPMAPPVGYYVQPHRRTNGLAIAAMVLGILWLYWLGSILALIFGYVAKSQIDASGGMQEGRGMAIAGIVLGWVGVGILTIVLIAAASNS